MNARVQFGQLLKVATVIVMLSLIIVGSQMILAQSKTQVTLSDLQRGTWCIDNVQTIRFNTDSTIEYHAAPTVEGGIWLTIGKYSFSTSVLSMTIRGTTVEGALSSSDHIHFVYQSKTDPADVERWEHHVIK